MPDRLGCYLLGPNDTPENGIYTGDARELALAIPDESVDLIFTDPVYQNIDDYRWLAETAVRVLKEDRACLVWCGIGHLLDQSAVLARYLSYRWQFAVMQMDGPTCPSKRFFYKGFNKWHTCLWFEKGKGDPDRHIVDFVISKKDRSSNHKWRKGQGSYYHWIDRFIKNNDIVLDPFTGGGTVPAVCKMLGRKYLAFEIDPATAETARQRVRDTQPPLFVPQAEQMPMEIGT
jgi:DNA modification methylase